LGGRADQFVPFVNLYRDTARNAGHDISKLQLAISSQFYVADNAQLAVDEFYPSYEILMNRVGRERGWAPLSRQQFDYMRSDGPLMVGNEQQVIDKILYQDELFKNTRFLAQFVTGYIPHQKVLRAIELYGTEIAPVIRKELGVTRNAVL